MEESTAFCHSVLRGAEGEGHPSAEEDARLQNGGQPPGAHILGAGDEDKLYNDPQNLNFIKFLLHVSILQPDFAKINQKLKFALFFQKVASDEK